MKLRRATEKDFEACKKLQKTDNADILYYDCGCKKESSSEYLTQENFLEDLSEIEQENDFTPEKFKEILRNKCDRIFVFEKDNDIIIAYLYLFKCQRYRWKLAEMQLEKKFQTKIIITEIFEELSLQKDIKEIDVCTWIESMQQILCNAGFVKEIPGYFRKIKKTPE